MAGLGGATSAEGPQGHPTTAAAEDKTKNRGRPPRRRTALLPAGPPSQRIRATEVRGRCDAHAPDPPRIRHLPRPDCLRLVAAHRGGHLHRRLRNREVVSQRAPGGLSPVLERLVGPPPGPVQPRPLVEHPLLPPPAAGGTAGPCQTVTPPA